MLHFIDMPLVSVHSITSGLFAWHCTTTTGTGILPGMRHRRSQLYFPLSERHINTPRSNTELSLELVMDAYKYHSLFKTSRFARSLHHSLQKVSRTFCVPILAWQSEGEILQAWDRARPSSRRCRRPHRRRRRPVDRHLRRRHTRKLEAPLLRLLPQRSQALHLRRLPPREGERGRHHHQSPASAGLLSQVPFSPSATFTQSPACYDTACSDLGISRLPVQI